MKKKLVAILIATAMSVSLVACSGDNSTADTKQETKTSVSAKDTKDTDKKEDSKKEDSKKKDSVDKKKSESEKKETEKKESETKTEDKKETKTASSDTKKEEAKKTSTGNNNSTSKPSNSSNNNNSNNNQPSTPSQPENEPSTPTPPTEQPSNPSGGNSSNSDNNSGNSGSDTNKPAEKPTEPETSEPEQPAPHEHNFNIVVSTNPGNCQTASSTVKKCSCGETHTDYGSNGSHNMVHHDAQGHEVTDYEYHAICGGCGADFGSGPDAATAAAKHIAKEFGDACQNYSSKRVPVGSHWEETSPAYDECSICGTRQ